MPQAELDSYKQAVNATLTVVDTVPPDRRDRVGVTELWTLKDMMGHLAYWDGRCVGYLVTVRDGGTWVSDTRHVDIHNAEQIAIRADWSWDNVMSEVATNRERLLPLLLEMGENDYGLVEHWDKHRSQIEDWMETWS